MYNLNKITCMHKSRNYRGLIQLNSYRKNGVGAIKTRKNVFWLHVFLAICSISDASTYHI